ncbi:MAG: DEAD/DEAH box helicase [Thermaerobacter sp.]|nr:DEAD/DEAH box helicase [Thermaerobacter sp.]
MFRLRPYQEAAVNAVLRASTRRPLVVLPTGSGKTVIAAALSQQVAGGTLMLVHREELVQQSVTRLHTVWPEGQVGIVRGRQDEADRRVVVASIQSLVTPGRVARLQPARFALVIVDEAHHAVSRSYKAVLEQLGFLPDPAPGRILLGITATPERGDQVSLRPTFERIVYRQSVGDLIRQGYLVPVQGLQVRSRLDLSHVRMKAGDYDLQALSLAVDTPDRNRLVVRAWQRYAAARRTVVFAVDVAHAEHLADAFRGVGVAADWVAGRLAASDRAGRLRALRDGRTQVLVNAMLLTEGWDEPVVSAVVLARPTHSRPLWIQMVGRGLRLHPDKTDCVVLDVADNRHDLVTLATLQDLGIELAPRTAAPPLPGRPRPSDPGDDLAAVTDFVATPRDLLARSQFAWRHRGRWLRVDAGPGRRVDLIPEGEGYQVRITLPNHRATLHPEPLSLEDAQSLAEDWVRQQGGTRYAAKDAAWRHAPATPKQQALAERLGLALADGLSRGEAQVALDDALAQARLQDPAAPWRAEPASPKQLAWLGAHHIRVPDGITKGEAADLMARRMGRPS